MAGRLEGRTAIVTGAGCVGPGWGNGRATCMRFAEEGARIFAVDLRFDTMEETLNRVRDAGGEIEPHLCDATDRAAVETIVASCVARFGGVDIPVNNVGGSAKGGPTDLDEADWDRQIDFKLKSVHLTCRSVLAYIAARGSGAIVNTSSTSGTRYTGAPQVAYASAKAAIIRVSKVTAVEFAPRASGSTPSCQGSCTRPWSKAVSRVSVLVATSRRCCNRGSDASRWAGWATGATPPLRRRFCAPKRRVSSLQRKSSSMAA